MAIVPDVKNWTWVLERVCPECSFDASTFEVMASPAAIRNNATEWVQILADPHVGTRPDPATWSALEYGCHVRDVFSLYTVRLRLMMQLDQPTFENWDQDETAVAEAYGNQDPAVVTRQLVEAADILATEFASVGDADWPRTGLRSDGASFSIHTFAQYMIHDPIHHVFDARKGLQLLSTKAQTQ